jgi:hypothetical protein
MNGRLEAGLCAELCTPATVLLRADTIAAHSYLPMIKSFASEETAPWAIVFLILWGDL